ncbi:MAG: glycosyltransferase [Clostridia bacterium]|nr:glycosyltransferase [Clostridia bacterium]
MENSVKVSVVIPVYNVEKYLCECVDSVLKQTYSSYEIILVDDGSTDSSGSICDSYAINDSRISVIHKENGGLSSARNEGLKKANGKYIYFLDSDDYLKAQTLEKLVETAEKENSDIVFFDAVSFADVEDNFKVSQNYIRKYNYKTGKGTAVFSEMQKNDEFHSAVPLLFIKKDLLEQNDIHFIDGIYYEDMLFTYQVFCCARVASQIKEAFYHRRYRKNSIMTSNKNPKHFASFTRVYEEVKSFSELLGIADEAFAKVYIVRCAFNCFNIYEKLSKNDKKENKEKIKAISDDILKNNAFGNKALQMRCYGKIFWVIYKLIEIPFMKRR